MQNYDVAIIGAGASGLMASWEMLQSGKKVIIIEAKDHIGGRAYTINDPAFEIPIETGAEFIHGNLETTQNLLKTAGIKYSAVEGEMWQRKEDEVEEQTDFIEDNKLLNRKFDEIKDDISITDFIKYHLQGQKYANLRRSLINYVEGYYAADANKASTLAMKVEWQTSDDEQYRIEGGYQLLIQLLHDQCKQLGAEFILSSPVKSIDWEKGQVTIIANDKRINATACIVTVSLGILQANSINFSPRIDNLLEAARKLGFGPVIKLVLQFTDPFWESTKNEDNDNMDELGFVFSQQTIPTWWTQFPKKVSLLTGWVGGPHALVLKDLNDVQIKDLALESLAKIFTIDVPVLEQKLKAYKVFNWINDPFVLGGYAYDTVGGKEARNQLKTPVQQTLYFSGEGLYEGPEIGTVEAALSMGKETAQKLIAHL